MTYRKTHYKEVKMKEFDTVAFEKELNSQVKLLDEMEAGTDEYKATVDGVAKLTDRLIELEKLELEKEAKERARVTEANEQQLKREQLAQEKRDRKISNLINIAGIAVPAALTIWGTFKTMEFEKEGTVTTIFGREFFKKLFYKK